MIDFSKEAVEDIDLVIPGEYYAEEKTVKLTGQEIEMIIDELSRTEHNLFIFLGYDKIINKLKEAKR